MNNDFNDLDDKNSNNVALIVGVTLVTIILAFISFISIFGVKDKIEKFFDYGKSKTKVQNQKISINTKENKKDDLGLFDGYMPKMQKKIKSNWTPPENNSSSKVILKYEINKDGSLGVIDTKYSDNKNMEKEAINALNKSAPFEPLPEGFVGEKVDVEFTFDYNINKK